MGSNSLQNTELRLAASSIEDLPSPKVEKVAEENSILEGDSDEKMFKAEELEDEISEEKMVEAKKIEEEEGKTSEKSLVSDDNESVTQLTETSDSEQEQENKVKSDIPQSLIIYFQFVIDMQMPRTDSTVRLRLTARLEKRDYQLAAERDRGEKLTEALENIKHTLDNTKDDNQQLREKLNKLLEDQSSLMQRDHGDVKKSTRKKVSGLLSSQLANYI